MHARVSTIEGQADRLDQTIDQVKSEVIPQLEGADGFKGFSLLVDRSSGKTIGISYWESESSMQATEDAMKRTRDAAAETAGAPAPTVERFEVVIDTQA